MRVAAQLGMDTIEVELEAPACATMKRNRHARSASGRLLLAVAALLPAAIRTRWCEELAVSTPTGPTVLRRTVGPLQSATATGHGHITLHLPEGWHREHQWMILFQAACGPPVPAA